MIEKESSGLKWLEFELFSSFHSIKHGLFFNLDDATKIFGVNQLFFLKQVHGSQIVQASKTIQEADAQVTQKKGMAIGVLHADCQAAIFYDPIHHAIATIHSGWRGSVQKIYTKTIERMSIEFQTDPKELLVAISPSLGPKSAEFIHYKKELPHSFWKHRIVENYFNFWEISREELLQAGIKADQIEIAELDNFQDSRFFSYRRDKTTERNVTAVSLL